MKHIDGGNPVVNSAGFFCLSQDALVVLSSICSKLF